MTIFSITVEDPIKLSGITAARNAYNKGNKTNLSDNDYIQYIIDNAATSYAHQFGVDSTTTSEDLKKVVSAYSTREDFLQFADKLYTDTSK